MTHFVITPQIDDHELSTHLVQWSRTLTELTSTSITTEINRYLTERTEQEKSIQYKVFVNMERNYPSTPMVVPRDAENLLSMSVRGGHISVSVLPRIEDSELMSYICWFLQSDSFIKVAIKMTTKNAAEWVEKILRDHQ